MVGFVNLGNFERVLKAGEQGNDLILGLGSELVRGIKLEIEELEHLEELLVGRRAERLATEAVGVARLRQELHESLLTAHQEAFVPPVTRVLPLPTDGGRGVECG